MKLQTIMIILAVGFMAGMITCNSCGKSYVVEEIQRQTQELTDSLLTVDSIFRDSMSYEISIKDSLIYTEFVRIDDLVKANEAAARKANFYRLQLNQLKKDEKEIQDYISSATAFDDYLYIRKWFEDRYSTQAAKIR